MSFLNPYKDNIKYLQDDGKARSLVYVGTQTKSGLGMIEGRSLSDLKKYWNYYRNENSVFASINTIAYNTVMVGYIIECENIEARKQLEILCRNTNLEYALLEATFHTLIFGDAFLEKRRNKSGEVLSLFPVDPKTVIINYNEYGKIESYQQEISGQKQPPINPEDIIHIRFFPIPSSPYGVSLLEPNLQTIERKKSTDESIYNAIKRHGTRKLVVTVGNEKDGQIPTDEVMKDIVAKLEDINEINEFIVPWVIKFSTIDEKGIQGIEEYYNFFQSQLVTGLMCPEEALGQGKGSTEATASVKAILFERMIKSYQYSLATAIRNELFSEFLTKRGFLNENSNTPIYASIKFNSVTEEDESLKAKWLGNLLDAFRMKDKMPFTRNEIRGFFGLNSRNDMEDVIDVVKPINGENVREEPQTS